MGALKSIAYHAPVIIHTDMVAAAAGDRPIFTADRSYEVLEITEVHSVAGAASSTLMIEKAPSGTAPASGTDLLVTAFAIDSTANTPVRKHVANGGLVAKASRTLVAGDSLVMDFTGTISAYVGAVTIVLRPITPEKSAY